MAALQGRKIVFAIGGGIAAYKACHALRLLVKQGAEVHVVMTQAATRFVGPLTPQALTQRPVLLDEAETMQEGRYGHLALARGAHLLLVAPATADLIGRLAAGLGDDAVTTTALACRCPVLLAPAMNTAMWEHELVQRNLNVLRDTRRHFTVGPDAGELADGDVGPGRMAEPEAIVEAAIGLLTPKDLAGRRVLVTAGPTREHLDPVRCLTNPSTGRMGFAVARAARDRGADVTLISGPTELPDPTGLRCVRVTSADELLAASRAAMEGVSVVVAAAAVADQRPAVRAEQKVKKRPGLERVGLVRTPDVLATLSAEAKGGKRPLFVGFAAETERLVDHARDKLRGKGLALVVANDVSAPDAGFGHVQNRVVLVTEGAADELPLQDKRDVAHAILDRVVALLAAAAKAGKPKR